MSYVHGIDSYNRANLHVDPSNGHPIWSGHGGEPAWSYASRRYGGPPPFWGRYLNPDPRRSIDRSEVRFIRNASGGGCRLLLVYNGLSSREVLGLRGAAARDRGRRAAAPRPR